MQYSVNPCFIFNISDVLALYTLSILLRWQAPDITVVEASDDVKNPSNNWQFVLLELAGSHYAAICIEQNSVNTGMCLVL